MWEGKEREDPRVLLKFPSRDWSRYRRPRAIMMLMVMNETGTEDEISWGSV